MRRKPLNLDLLEPVEPMVLSLLGCLQLFIRGLDTIGMVDKPLLAEVVPGRRCRRIVADLRVGDLAR